MKLVILTAVLAVCGAALVNRRYLPPVSTKTTGGSSKELLTPIGRLPFGSYTNEDEGVVVDAVAPGTRTAGTEPTGLGGPRISYGSTNSKVGEAAFSRHGELTRISPSVGDRASKDSNNNKTNASTVKFINNVGLEKYNYSFETDNGIVVGENGVVADGTKAQGEFSYKGSDGKIYSVTYVAGKEGYQPVGIHLPTPPPIPKEIIKALEKNAQEEIAGIFDDGSYKAQKYNKDGARPSNNGNRGNNGHSEGDRVIIMKDDFRIPGNGNQHLGSVQSFPKYGTTGLQTNSPSPSLEFHSHSHNQFSKNLSKQGSVSHSTLAIQKNQNLRLPENFKGIAAYGSAITGAAAAAIASADAGNIIPEFKTQFVSNTFQFKTDSGHSVVAKSNPPSITTESSAQGSDTLAEAISTNKKINENSGYLPPLNTFSAASAAPHFKFNPQATSSYVPLSFIASSSLSGQRAKVGQIPSPTIPQLQQVQQMSSRFGDNSHRISPTGSSFPSSYFGLAPYSQPGRSPTTGLKQSESHIANTHYSDGVHVQRFGMISEIKPTKLPSTELTTPFEPDELLNKTKPTFNIGSTLLSPKHLQRDPNPYQTALDPFTHPAFSSLVADFSKSSHKAQHGTNSPYHYSKFLNPIPMPTSKLKVNEMTNTQAGRYQGTALSYNNGITQAAVSPFPSEPTASTTLELETSQFEVKPAQVKDKSFRVQTSQQGFLQSSANHSGQKPFPQSQLVHSSQQVTSHTQDQKYQPGTIYEYKKPPSSQEFVSKQVIPSPAGSQIKTGEISLINKHPQPFDNDSLGSSLQQLPNHGSIFNSQSTIQFGQKPAVQNLIMPSSINENNQNSSSTTINEYNKETPYKETSTSTESQLLQNPGHNAIGFYNEQLINQNKKSQGPQNFNPFSAFQSQFKISQSPSKPFSSSLINSAFKETQVVYQNASQLDDNPLSQSLSSIERIQFGSPGSPFKQKPIISQGQHIQGTLYEYKRPTENFPPENKSPSVSPGSHLFQNSSIRHGLKTQFGKNPTSDFQSDDKFQQTETPPISGIGTEIKNQLSGKPQISQRSSGLSKSYSSSSFQQTHLGSLSASQLSQNPASTLGSSSVSSQGQIVQFVSQPNFQVGSKTTQNQFKTSPHHIGQNPGQESRRQDYSHRQIFSSVISNPSAGAEFKNRYLQFESNFGQKPHYNRQTNHTSNFAEVNKYSQTPLNISSNTGNSISQIQGSSSSANQFVQDVQKIFGSQVPPLLILKTDTSNKETFEHSPGFQFDQISQTSIPISTNQPLHTAQFGQKVQRLPSVSVTSDTQAPTPRIQFGVKPFSSSQNSSASFSQSDFGSSPQVISLKPQSNKETISTTASVPRTFEKYKPYSLASFGSSQIKPDQNATSVVKQSQPSDTSSASVINQQNIQSSNNLNIQAQNPSFNHHLRQTVTQKPLSSQDSVYQYDQFNSKNLKNSQGSIQNPFTKIISSQSWSQSLDTEFKGYNYEKPPGVHFDEHLKPTKMQLEQTNVDSHSPIIFLPLKPSVLSTYVDKNSALSSDSRKTVPLSIMKSTKIVASEETPTDDMIKSGVKPSHKILVGNLRSAKPSHSIKDPIELVYPQQPSQTFPPLPGRPVFPSVQSTDVPSKSSSLDSFNEGSSLSTVQTTVSGDNVIPARHSFVGKGEKFEGLRRPQTFNDKTGYHY